MTETSGTKSGAYVSGSNYEADQPTGWVGWIAYAGVMMIVLGMFQMIEGFVALFDDSYFAVPKSGLVLHVSYTGWGWVHLGLGLLAMLGGYALMAGKTWGRVYAVIFAMANATANLVFLAAYPVWSVLMITIDALVIWAVCVHGKEVRTDY